MKARNGSFNYLSFLLEARMGGRRRGGGGKNVIFVSRRVYVYMCIYIYVCARVNIEEQQGITRLLQRGWKTMLVRQINEG